MTKWCAILLVFMLKMHTGYMVLVWIAIAVGILLVAILIVKATKTNPREIAGMDMRCKKCGTETGGMMCPKCNKTFGV
ncbi:hypothetical protein [Nitrosopumilus sp. b3]|uniref:hypothetical protein n=1 Tax=Nitrosopumilus sp. b3 TaxID=2109909 RepID=UPI0015F68F3B|nr:hypothetical protein [Nitrosopumilus sp. b3]